MYKYYGQIFALIWQSELLNISEKEEWLYVFEL